jgi:hypothetical protein
MILPTEHTLNCGLAYHLLYSWRTVDGTSSLGEDSGRLVTILLRHWKVREKEGLVWQLNFLLSIKG